MTTLSKNEAKAINMMNEAETCFVVIPDFGNVSMRDLYGDTSLSNLNAEAVIKHLGGNVPCDYGHCEDESTHQVVYRRENGDVYEMRRMCQRHAEVTENTTAHAKADVLVPITATA